MTRKTLQRLIRRTGQDFLILPKIDGDELLKATCRLRSNNKELFNADSSLQPGDILHPLEEPHVLYLVTARRQLTHYEEYDVSRITHHGQLFRFSQEVVRDTFGRPSSASPVLIYSDLPVVLLPSVSDKDESSPAIAATTTSYTFLTSDIYQVKPKDRLTISDMNLVVDSIQLAKSGLIKFTATATA